MFGRKKGGGSIPPPCALTKDQIMAKLSDGDTNVVNFPGHVPTQRDGRCPSESPYARGLFGKYKGAPPQCSRGTGHRGLHKAKGRTWTDGENTAADRMVKTLDPRRPG